MSLFPNWLAAAPPDAAVEIGPDFVSAASIVPRGQVFAVTGFAMEPLPPGAVAPSLTQANILNPGAVKGALRSVVETLGTRPSRVALVIPDIAARVALVRFEQIPARAEDLDQLVRWQLRKSSPFPVEDACVSYTTASTTDRGAELLVVLARRALIEEYEQACSGAGLHAGIVDLATLNVINTCLAAGSTGGGDCLLVHMRPHYTSLAILRGQDVLFFRTRAEDDGGDLSDLVHQTAMYYQDRLSGQGFGRVLLAGAGPPYASPDMVSGEVGARLGQPVDRLDPTSVAVLTDRIAASPAIADALGPLVGVLIRTREAMVAA